jgi:hypothetical protein
MVAGTLHSLAHRIISAPAACRRLALALPLLIAAALSIAPLPAAAQAAGPAGSTVTRTAFDHLTTGFELTGQHRDLPCESCHVNAIFKGTPKDCASCHGVGVTVRATAKPASHILTSNKCEACHTPVSWSPAVNFDHTEVMGSCSSCHNGVQATGKGPNHIDTNLECDACHSTIGWAGAVFNHLNITGNCARCHDGKQATGTPSNHVAINGAPCESCHANNVFTSFRMTNASTLAPAGMVHTAVSTAACASCHEAGLSWVGTPPTVLRPQYLVPGNASSGLHVATGECATCHTSTQSFLGATSFPVNHIPLPMGASSTCSTCHTNAADFSTYVMGDTGHAVVAGETCLTCHGAGKSFYGFWAAQPLKLPPANHVTISASAACEGCHIPTNFTTFVISNTSSSAPPGMVHSVVAGTACLTCHAMNVGSKFIQPVKEPPANHIPSGATACEACHSPAVFTNFLIPNTSTSGPPGMVHTALASGTACLGCHAAGVGSKFVQPVKELPAIGSPGGHVATNGADCGSCHSPSVYSSFMMNNITATSPPGMVHTPVSANACSSCHEANLSWLGAPVTVVRPQYLVPGNPSSGLHQVGGECSDCHFNTVSFLNASNYPTNHIPNPGGSGATCTNCHTTAGDFTKYVMSHNGISMNCAQCHASGLKFAGVWTTLPLKAPPSSHIPFAAACESCHSNSVFTNFIIPNTSTSGPPGMVHAALASGTACLTCHAAGVGSKFVQPVKELPAIGSPGGHVATNGADCGSCHSPTVYSSFMMTNATATAPPGMVHSLVSSLACSSCHEAGKTWLGMPVTVVRPQYLVPGNSNSGLHATTGECSNCHMNTVSFLGATVYPTNHIPNPGGSTATCTNCHTTGDYSVYVMSHAGVASNTCAQCHGAGLTFAGVWTTQPLKQLPAIGSPGGHVAVGAADCGNCHSPTVFTSFKMTNATATAPPGMVHSFVSANACSSCHEANLTWLGSPATVVRPQYLVIGNSSSGLHPATGECSNCHLNTTSFLGAVSYPSNHIPNPGGASSTCSTCHTTGDYSLYVMSHAGISTKCAQCHAYGLQSSFAGNWTPKPLVGPPPGATGHIPSNPPNGTLTIACESCHSPTAFTTFSGTVMKHAYVTSMKCMACHEYGMTWKTNTGVRLWTRDGPDHYTGQDCGGSGCHTARDKHAIRRAAVSANGSVAIARGSGASGLAPALVASGAGIDHRRVAGTACVSCHTPASGNGKPASHIATSDRCASCHGTIAWLPVTQVDHSQVLGTCAGCHNGTVATGKGHNHIASGTDCQSCHTTNAWTPARFDHAGVAAHTCKSCHDGVHASGLPVNHVVSLAQCDTCHGTVGWKPAKLDHSTLTSNCASCHNNKIAIGASPAHFNTQRDCATCHSYPDWTVLHFVHSSAAYPGDHKAALTCASCHSSNAEQIPWPAPADKGSCGGCHAKDFVPAHHPKSPSGPNYTASELRDCTGACHVYTDATLRTVSKSLPGPYHRVSDAAFRH